MSKYCYYKGNPRKVLEKKLGRKLTKNEEAHHINKCRKDARPSNLTALTKAKHKKLHRGPRERLKRCGVCGGKTYESSFVNVLVQGELAKGLRHIAFANHRRGIQTDANLAISEYIHKHEILSNRRDNGK